jgi:hypothetical protein
MRVLLLMMLLPAIATAQSVVITAFPSLQIPASSRGLGMGNVGIASSQENQQLYYNGAKAAFTQNFHQAAVSYMPWMNGVSEDTRFINLNYLGNVFNTSALGVALSYLNLGTLTARDNNGAAVAQYRPREFTFGVSYSLQMSEHHALGACLRLLGQSGFGEQIKNVFSVCGDLNYYGFVSLGGNHRKIEWGAVLQNLGAKISYGLANEKTFLPTNLGVGVSYTCVDEEDANRFTVAVDVNKLLVPADGGPGKGILAGMFASFGEPGQLQSLRVSTGLEYGYISQFFLRGGVSLENQNRGDRKYFGLGVGYKGLVLDQSFAFDVHYIAPFGMAGSVSPFQNCYGFTLGVNFGNFQ